MSTPFTVTHPFCKTPTFVELQNWAKEYEILISGNEQSGDFSHSKVKGDYSYENNGGLRGKFTGLHPLGKITGEYILTTGKAEVTITEKGMFIPEGQLKSAIAEGLKIICTKSPPAA